MRADNCIRETDVFVADSVYEKHNVCLKTCTIRRYFRSKRQSTFCSLSLPYGKLAGEKSGDEKIETTRDVNQKRDRSANKREFTNGFVAQKTGGVLSFPVLELAVALDSVLEFCMLILYSIERSFFSLLA